MELLITAILLLSIVIIISQIFDKTALPISLMLVLTGIFLSFIPMFPTINMSSEVVLNIFIPLIIYQISSFSSWRDIRKNLRPITFLSIGHVIFMTITVAIVVHTMIPDINWPLAFILGAVISPPDDVAIVAIAEKIRLPEKILTILEGEAMLNDATALVLFRFALAAAITHQFSVSTAIGYFFIVLVSETFYGILIGSVMGELRLKIDNPIIHILASLITPFLAYIPAEMLGGSGILATAVTGFVIGHRYAIRFSPEFRLFSRSIWPALGFAMQSVLFLWVGLNMKTILLNISSIHPFTLFFYSAIIVATVILGRFIWVYTMATSIPILTKPFIHLKREESWQSLFIVSWAGMRGAVSLAAAAAVPLLPFTIAGANPRDLLIFFVICVIAFTLMVQGLTLPWLLKKLGLNVRGEHERYAEHISELSARLYIAKTVLHWLYQYKKEIIEDEKTLKVVKLFIREYRLRRNHLEERIAKHAEEDDAHDEKNEASLELIIAARIIQIERQALLNLWREEKINLAVRNKLMDNLDHRYKHLLD